VSWEPHDLFLLSLHVFFLIQRSMQCPCLICHDTTLGMMLAARSLCQRAICDTARGKHMLAIAAAGCGVHTVASVQVMTMVVVNTISNFDGSELGVLGMVDSFDSLLTRG
jgi:hypothetical protein